MILPRLSIIVEIYDHDEGAREEIAVNVRGTGSTAEVIGYLDLARMQHRDAKSVGPAPTPVNTAAPSWASEQAAPLPTLPARRPSPYPPRGAHVQL